MKATAYAPAHITGFFKIYPNGSTGAGVNLEEGVTTTVFAKPATKQQIKIKINGKKMRADTSKTVIKKFLALNRQKFEIKAFHKTRLPIGYGLGASGAGALSLALALNKALGTKLGFKEAQKIAAEAEIENGTGLGDVYAQEFKGLIRGLPPYPSKKAANIPAKATHCVCAFFAPIKTSKIIRSK
ncbi:MAG: GHMP kinase, partial [archaeon]